MPANLRRSCESYSTMVEETFTLLAHPGDDPKARQTPEFMGKAVKVLEMLEENSEKPRPLGLKEDLLLDSTLSSPFFAEAIKRAWFVYAKDNMETLVECIAKLKESVGISPSHESDCWKRGMDGAKYKSVVKKSDTSFYPRPRRRNPSV